MRICFTIDGKTYCINVPLLIKKWVPPWEPVEDHEQSPWITGVDDKLALDLQILATVSMLTEKSSARVHSEIHHTLEKAVTLLQSELPHGAKIVLDSANKIIT